MCRFEFIDDIDNAGIAKIRAIFLESQTKDQDSGVNDMDALVRHQTHHLMRHM